MPRTTTGHRQEAHVARVRSISAAPLDNAATRSMEPSADDSATFLGMAQADAERFAMQAGTSTRANGASTTIVTGPGTAPIIRARDRPLAASLPSTVRTA